MKNVRRLAKAGGRNNLLINFNKEIIKEVILESYKEIEEQRSKKHIPTEFLKLPLNLIFGATKVVLGFLAFVVLITIVNFLYTNGFNINTFFSAVICLSIVFLFVLFAFVFHKTGSEVEKETDKYYIAAFFSAIVSLVALIVSLIGLLIAMK